MRLRALLLATAFVAFALPAVADEATECDRLAASPDDLGRVAPGVLLEDVDGAAAEAACRDEIEKNPTAGRFIFQLARALESEQKTDEARDTYQAAVDAGYLVGYLSLGRFYEDGIGTETDYAKAAQEYQMAVDKGLKAANGNLGYLHEEGLGFPKDTKEAARLYQLGVDAGDPWSAVSLGLLYENGDGVTDRSQAGGQALPPCGRGRRPVGGVRSRPEIQAGRRHREGRWQGDLLVRPCGQAEERAGRARACLLLPLWTWACPRTRPRPSGSIRLAIASDDEEAAFNGENELAWMFAQSGRNLEEAASLIDDALERADDDDTRSAALDTAAWVDHMRGNNADALKKLQEAIDIDAEFAPYFDRLGDIYAALGRVDQARAAWQEALTLPAPDEDVEPDWSRAAVEQKLKGNARSPAPRRRRRLAATRSGRRSKADRRGRGRPLPLASAGHPKRILLSRNDRGPLDDLQRLTTGNRPLSLRA